MSMKFRSLVRIAACGAIAAGFLTTASAQEAAPSLLAPQVEAGAQASTGALATFRRNPLTVTNASNQSVHVFPTVSVASNLRASTFNPSGPLVYRGGSIMPTIQIYNIFWKPATLQSGAVANMSAHYMAVANGLAKDYAGHSISSNNTQYYQNISSVVTYVSGLSYYGGAGGSLGGAYLDTNPYPASGCVDSLTPGNCVTDAQLQSEILRVMALKGWTGGLNKMYLIYTAQGEGSCFDSSSTACSYTYYCAYHGAISGATPVVYANEPYGYPPTCQVSGTPSPTGDAAADTAMTSSSHEITEAITDPLPGSGWTDAAGSEIGDICAYIYGVNTYDSAKANEFWNGRFYELQEEYDNHTASCVQKGP